MSDRLFQAGVFAQSLGFPTVPRGQARLRTIVSATHTRQDLDYALEMFGKIGKELGVIGLTYRSSWGCLLPLARLLRDLHQGLHQGRPRQAVHVRNAGGLSLLRPRHQHGGARRAALAPARAEVPPGLLPGLHDAPVAGAPRHLRPVAGDLRDRPAAALQRPRHRSACGCRSRFTSSRVGIPGPVFADGTVWLLIGFLLMNLLVLLEVADRLSLKRDLEVAREIQQAMLPDGMWSGMASRRSA